MSSRVPLRESGPRVSCRPVSGVRSWWEALAPAATALVALARVDAADLADRLPEESPATRPNAWPQPGGWRRSRG
ncbi:hypothetical protein ACFY0A_35145 [Streptomyces sp. NPDC001698]|uniref:hypothetical protein n=1 Tax=unclassified Streptomyces TaxID=2593676 RepID=UPI003683E776